MAWPKGVSREEWELAKGAKSSEDSSQPEAASSQPETAAILDALSKPKDVKVPKYDYPELDPKAPPPNLFSATVKKLDVFGLPGTDPNKPVPGHELCWFSDKENGRFIGNAIQSGWRFVEKEEIAVHDLPTSPGNDALDSRVRRWVGMADDHAPEHNYLMKIPEWLYALHMTGPDSVEVKVHQVQEQQLAMGTYNNRDVAHTYTAARAPGVAPNARTGLPAVKMGRYYKPPNQT